MKIPNSFVLSMYSKSDMGWGMETIITKTHNPIVVLAPLKPVSVRRQGTE